MVTRDFSGLEIAKVLVNVGPFYVKGRTGSHIKLRCDPPAHHNTPPRTVTIPRVSRVKIGTLRSIANQAGARDFDRFCEFIDDHR